MDERQRDRGPGNRARVRAMIALGGFAASLIGLFVWQPDSLYLWIKALHVIAVMSWMAALLYMPRLFIYHTDAAPGSEQSETFKMMEQRLLTVIMNPAMMISWVLGLYLAWSVYDFQGGWLHAKLLFVVMLTGRAHALQPGGSGVPAGRKSPHGTLLAVDERSPDAC